MRATEAKAIELLHRLWTEVRILYDDSSTRLHATVWIFYRVSEYSTAYVGSSNLPHSTFEWKVRIAKADQPDVTDETAALFETYWNGAALSQGLDGRSIPDD